MWRGGTAPAYGPWCQGQAMRPAESRGQDDRVPVAVRDRRRHRGEERGREEWEVVPVEGEEPAEVVRHARELLGFVNENREAFGGKRDAKREQKMANLSKSIREMKCILYGNDLKDGELIHGESFSLFAAMSALEVLNPCRIILIWKRITTELCYADYVFVRG